MTGEHGTKTAARRENRRGGRVAEISWRFERRELERRSESSHSFLSEISSKFSHDPHSQLSCVPLPPTTSNSAVRRRRQRAGVAASNEGRGENPCVLARSPRRPDTDAPHTHRTAVVARSADRASSAANSLALTPGCWTAARGRSRALLERRQAEAAALTRALHT